MPLVERPLGSAGVRPYRMVPSFGTRGFCCRDAVCPVPSVGSRRTLYWVGSDPTGCDQYDKEREFPRCLPGFARSYSFGWGHHPVMVGLFETPLYARAPALA